MTAGAHRACRALEAWWFAPSSKHQVGIFRPFLVGWFGWFYWERLFIRLATTADRPLEFYAPPSLARWFSLPPVSQAALTWLEPLGLLLVAFAFVGLMTRVTLIALAALNLFLGLSANSWGYTAHASALPTLVLWIVAFAPGVTSFSLDALLLAAHARRTKRLPSNHAPEVIPRRPVSIWPVRTLLIVLCLLYTSAGVSKLRYSGFQWTDGRTLAFYLGGGSERGSAAEQRFIADRQATSATRFRDGWGLVDHAYVGRPTSVGLWVAKQSRLLELLSWGALLWELTFPIALLGGWPRTLAFGGGIGFHAAIHLTLSINFSSYLVCYLLFVDWVGLARSIGRRARFLPARSQG